VEIRLKVIKLQGNNTVTELDPITIAIKPENIECCLHSHLLFILKYSCLSIYDILTSSKLYSVTSEVFTSANPIHFINGMLVASEYRLVTLNFNVPSTMCTILYVPTLHKHEIMEYRIDSRKLNTEIKNLLEPRHIFDTTCISQTNNTRIIGVCNLYPQKDTAVANKLVENIWKSNDHVKSIPITYQGEEPESLHVLKSILSGPVILFKEKKSKKGIWELADMSTKDFSKLKP